MSVCQVYGWWRLVALPDFFVCLDFFVSKTGRCQLAQPDLVWSGFRGCVCVSLSCARASGRRQYRCKHDLPQQLFFSSFHNTVHRNIARCFRRCLPLFARSVPSSFLRKQNIPWIRITAIARDASFRSPWLERCRCDRRPASAARAHRSERLCFVPSCKSNPFQLCCWRSSCLLFFYSVHLVL
jgi:hypothetical protein